MAMAKALEEERVLRASAQKDEEEEASARALKLPEGRVLVIMRGLSGSGKTQLANEIVCELRQTEGDVPRTGRILSTDDFFVSETEPAGKYAFDPHKLKAAHAWNVHRAFVCMDNTNAGVVIVDNTHSELWEALPYVLIARATGYNVVVREPCTAWKNDPAQCHRMSTHHVPIAAIKGMLDRWQEDYTPERIRLSQPPKGRGETVLLAQQLISARSEE